MQETTPRRAAIIAGSGYAALFVLAIYANFFVREGLVVAGDADATLQNIAQSEVLFRTGIAAFLVIFLLDVVVAWALHIVFRTVDRTTSLLAAWFRIVYTVFLGVGAVFMFAAAELVGRPSPPESPTAEQLALPVTLLMDAFNFTWLIGLAAFGVHLVLLGVIMVRTHIAPSLLGAVLVAAGTSYLADTFAHTLLTDYSAYAGAFLVVVATTAVIAEFAFMAWLLRRAGKPGQMATLPAASATPQLGAPSPSPGPAAIPSAPATRRH